jgi:hypothetical protein
MNTQDWPTQDIDIAAANKIIDEHVDLNEGDPLNLIEVIVDQENKKKRPDVRMPDWIIDLAKHFTDEYGLAKGQLITSKILTKCLLKGQTIH